MAKVISQLASMSEGALGKSVKMGIQVKDRVEKMVHAITELDDRVAALEKRVDALEKPKRRTAARKPAASRSSAKASSDK
jgi:hypothetical protein